METRLSFDLVCIGSGGGPVESDLSAYLLKANESRWEDGIVALEAGSGIGALTNILEKNPRLFDDKSSASVNRDVGVPPRFLAAQVYSYIQTFLISHSHLDHVLSLILSAGSLPSPPALHTAPPYRRRIMGTAPVLEDLSSSIFNDRLWPNLASWSSDPAVPNHMYLYDPIPLCETNFYTATAETINSLQYRPINHQLSCLAFPVSHGLCVLPGDPSPSTYTSTAYFIRNDNTKRQFVFFGDVEPDSVAKTPSTANVWKQTAALIARPVISDKNEEILYPRTLDAIFLECSWTTARKDEELYGHLNPQHVLQEILVLASEVVRARGSEEPNSATSTPTTATYTTAPENPPRAHPPTTGMKRKRRNTLKKTPKRSRSTNASISSIASVTPKPSTPIASTQLLERQKLIGALQGVRLYVMHFKSPLSPCIGGENGNTGSHIAKEIQQLMDQEELGLIVIPVEQGMHIEI